jgi:predicted Zn-dependent protease
MANSPKRSNQYQAKPQAALALIRERSYLDFELDFFAHLLERLPQQSDLLLAQAENHARKGQHREALLLLQRLQAQRPADAQVHFLLARRYAVLKQTDLALDALRHALALGYTELRALLHDNEFEQLRRDPRFNVLLRDHAQAQRGQTSE